MNCSLKVTISVLYYQATHAAAADDDDDNDGDDDDAAAADDDDADDAAAAAAADDDDDAAADDDDDDDDVLCLAVDVWSVGCILAELLTGKPLFPGTDRILTYPRTAGLLLTVMWLVLPSGD